MFANKRVRKSLMGFAQLLALALAFVLVYTLAGDGAAKAYIPATFEPSINGQDAAQIKAEMTVSPKKPDYGQQITYTGTLDFNNYANQGPTQITVTQSPLAPFDSKPSVANFSWSGGQPASITGPVDNGGGSWTFTATGIPSGAKATFATSAHVVSKDKGVSGAPVYATIAAQSTTSVNNWKPQFGPLEKSNVYSRGGSCFAVMSAKTKPLEQGGWIMDIKFGDSSGRGNVGYLNRGKTFIDATKPANGHDAIQFIQNGKDITAQILAKGTYEASDPSQPIYVTPPAGTRFVDSLDWPYDLKTFTGNTWVPAGTTIHVAREVEFKNCVFPSPTFDPSVAVYTLQFGRPNIPVEESAQASFVLPGEQAKPEACANVYWLNEQPTNLINSTRINAPSHFTAGLMTQLTPNPQAQYKVTLPNQAGNRIWEISGRAGSLAMTQKHPERMYYISYDGNVYYVVLGNSNPRQPIQVPSSKLPFYEPNKPTGKVYSATFDQEGNLYTWHDGKNGAELYRMNPDAGTGWQQITTINKRNYPGLAAYDIVFDADDNLYAVTSNKDSERVASDQKIVKIPAAAWKSGQVRLNPENTKQAVYTNNLAGSTTSLFGLAFAPDGNLYIGFASLLGPLEDQKAVLGRVNLDDLNRGAQEIRVDPAVVGTNQAPGLNAFSDLASCSFGAPPASPAKFKVQKAVVDPVTGIVAPAGTTSPHKLKLREVTENGKTVAKGNVTFYITVSNIGTTAGTPAEINDEFDLGDPDFRIENVKISGANAQLLHGEGTSAVSFQLRPGEIPGGELVTYKLTATIVTDKFAGNSWRNMGICKTDKGGEKGFGIFNRVTMDGDSDGADNNDACVPIEPEPNGQLYLFKAIQNPDGSVNAGATARSNGLPEFHDGDQARNLAKFQLSASGPSPVTGTFNATRGSYQNGVGGVVRAGSYALAETPIAADVQNYAFGNTYECYDYTAGRKLGTNMRQVDVTDGHTVLCYVVNKPTIPFHVEKNATHPDENQENAHYGETVAADAEGNVTMEYTIVVTNDGDITGDTGVITDLFRVPAGLKWQVGADGKAKPATAVFEPGTSGAAAQGLPNKWSEKEFTAANGVVLTPSIRNMKPHSSASIKVSIPLALDEATFAQNAKTLGTCDAYSMNGENLVTTRAGVPNTVSLEDESPAYSRNYLRDNIACIPVTKPERKVKIQKLAAIPDQAYPNGAYAPTGLPKPSHIGQAVRLNANNEGTLKYQIFVSNSGEVTTDSGPIIDNFTLPEGLTWGKGDVTMSVELKYAGTAGEVKALGYNKTVSKEQLASATGAQLLSNITQMQPRGFAVITLDIPVQAAVDFDKHRDALASCTPVRDANGVPGYTAIADGKGVPNKVSLGANDANEDRTYSKNWERDNLACIPVVADYPAFKVQKTATYPSQTDYPGHPHIGETKIITKENGKFNADYTVTVTNIGEAKGNAGRVLDTFSVPVGLKWQAGVDATIETLKSENSIVVLGENGRPVQQTRHVSQAQFVNRNNGYLLASTIEAVQVKGTVTFKISIPLERDDTIGVTGQSLFQENAGSLARCDFYQHAGQMLTGPVGPAPKENCGHAAARRQHTQLAGAGEYAHLTGISQIEAGVRLEETQVGIFTQQQQTAGILHQSYSDGCTEQQHTTGFLHEQTHTGMYVEHKVTEAYLQQTELTSATLAAQALQVRTERWGIPNSVQLTCEDRAHSINWWYDNITCIPVREQPSNVDVVVRKMDAAPTETGLGLNGAEFSICDSEPKFGPDGKLATACTPMTKMPEVAGKALANVSEAAWNTSYATYGQVCNKYLPKGVTTPKWADRNNYGAAFSACISQYAAALSGGSAASNQTDGSLFWAQQLKPGQDYWIVETKAPLCDQKAAAGDSRYCYSLLPEPVKISFDAKGAIVSQGKQTDCNPFSGQCKPQQGNVKGYDIFQNTVVVHDQRQAELPKAGGTGPGPLAGLGALVVLASGGYLAFTRRRA